MTRSILKIASAAIVLTDKDFLSVLRWNCEECGIRASLAYLVQDIRDLTDSLEYGKDGYWNETR